MRVVYSIGAPIGGYGFSIPAYYGALAFSRRGFLSEIICTSMVQDVPAPRVVRIPTPRLLNLNHDFRNFFFDTLAAYHLERADVLYGWSTHCLKQIARAHQLGMKTMVDRGAAEPHLQQDLLNRAYARVGLSPPYITLANLSRTTQELQRADGVIVSSTFVRDSLLAQGHDESKLYLIRLGVDAKQFRPERVIANNSVFRILSVGNLGIQKGTHLLLDAFGKLTFPANLDLVGPVLREMRADTRLSDRRVRLHGLVPHGRLSGIYNQAAVFVLPSIQDGFGLVVLEAMACGRPVVITDAVGAKDVVQDGYDGFVLPAGDAKSIADALQYLYENPREARRMGARARRKALKYSWERYMAGVVQATKCLL